MNSTALSDPPLRQAESADPLARLAEVLGREHVLSDPASRQGYARSSAAHSTEPSAIVRPASTEQVQAVVRIAGECGLSLYPLSRGCNWGYGDARAPTAGQVIVDLGRMDRILELNRRLGYVVVEAGVSQGQLWEYLQAHAPELWMDSTGAGPEASLVGNALDRGFGHTRYGDHTLSACGMEIVLADGRVLNTGFGHYDNAVASRVYRYGVGPTLDGLFTQSNLGIVTRIGLWLMPAPERFCAFFFSADDEHALEDMIERLAPLRMQGLLQSAIHIGNDLRLISARTRYPWERAQGQTPLPPELRHELGRELGIGAWTGCGTITGTAGHVRATIKAVRRALRPYRVICLNDRRMAMARRVGGWLGRVGLGAGLRTRLETLDPLYRLLKGEPTSEALHGTAWRVRGEVAGEFASPLDVHAGIMWSSPVVPMTGPEARRLLELIEPIYARHGFEPMVTFTMITERAMVAVTNLYFDTREPEEAERATACYHALGEVLMDHGYVPYRVAHEGVDKLRRGSSVFWDVVAQLKQSLDPQQVISPGRYQPRPRGLEGARESQPQAELEV